MNEAFVNASLALAPVVLELLKIQLKILYLSFIMQTLQINHVDLNGHFTNFTHMHGSGNKSPIHFFPK